MIRIDSSCIDAVALTHIGNKYMGAQLEQIKSCTKISDSEKHDLGEYFLSRINFVEECRFKHSLGLQYNKIYSLSRDFFSKKKSLIDIGDSINQILFDSTKNAKIKEGYLFVVSFRHCIEENREIEALGIFKAETFDTFLQCNFSNEGPNITSLEGISLHKLDKGCIIFNCKEDEGFVINVYNTGRKSDLQYWNEDFLGIDVASNDTHNVNEIIKVCTKLLKTNMSSENSTIEKIALLSELKSQIEAGEIDLGKLFEASNMGKDSIIPEDIPNRIKVNKADIGKARPKAVIKLDDNFTISVSGGDRYIKKGVDPNSGMHYYQFFYKDER